MGGFEILIGFFFVKGVGRMDLKQMMRGFTLGGLFTVGGELDE